MGIKKAALSVWEDSFDIVESCLEFCYHSGCVFEDKHRVGGVELLARRVAVSLENGVIVCDCRI